ncbi:hypothetical protein VK792_19380 [Mesobacterium sp. TK19101]|uniref:Uncharacterized protein n=1 Tax=Mesobacterium hydrothermale TaxID=3111907 RepID=A0ABU6HLW4_9RHOB|nr:hypothetical protein [Mesobacterium sp. TK19101]MEC3863448.1 hypothetical protein [Mesobacterium sp. TK19101]
MTGWRSQPGVVWALALILPLPTAALTDLGMLLSGQRWLDVEALFLRPLLLLPGALSFLVLCKPGIERAAHIAGYVLIGLFLLPIYTGILTKIYALVD